MSVSGGSPHGFAREISDKPEAMMSLSGLLPSYAGLAAKAGQFGCYLRFIGLHMVDEVAFLPEKRLKILSLMSGRCGRA